MFANIEQLEEAFVTRQFTLNETVSVNGVDYRLHENDQMKFKDIFTDKIGTMIYVPISESAPVLALVWRADQRNNVIPSQIVEIHNNMVNEAAVAVAKAALPGWVEFRSSRAAVLTNRLSTLIAVRP